MPRLRHVLTRVAVASLIGFVAYGVAGGLIAQLPGVKQVPDMPRVWPDFLPSWPFAAILAIGGAAVALDVIVWAVVESKARGETERRRQLAEQWPQGADAKAAAASGNVALRVLRFRAQGLPRAIRLDWDQPATTYDRVLIYRSNQGFALSPAGDAGQAVAYEGEEEECVDTPLTPDRVFFYTLFGLGRGQGDASPPAWAWAVTLKPGKGV